MKYLEKIKVVQFFLFEQQDVPLGEITGIFGPNGSGKSSLLDAVQIAMLGANSRLCALNAQADEQATTRSLRAYCLGQYGESPEHRARDNATTYITLIWRDTETGAPLSMGVCLYASAERDSHDVLGRYILPDVELSMGDHLEVVDGEERPRAWATFRHQLIERSKVSGQDPLFADSDRYIRAALLALRGAGSAPVPEAFTRAFRFALRMRFDKTVDQIVRNDVLEARPTNIKKFKEVTESFRRLAEMVAQVEAKIADGERVSVEYDKAADESQRAVTWNALSKMAAAQVANENLEQARIATEKAEDVVQVCEDKKTALELEANDAKTAAERARVQREAHAAHKDYGALQTTIQAAEGRVQAKRTEVANSIQLVRRALNEAAGSDFLKAQLSGLQIAVSALDQLKGQVADGTATRDGVVAALRPAVKTAHVAFNELFSQGGTLKRALDDARDAERQAKESLARVRAGRAPLSTEAQRLLTELGDHGVQATPVCDLVRIVDPEWQPVIESYLKRNMEALLVSADQEKDAFRIYRSLTGSQAVYGAKIAMESRQTISKRLEQGSVAELIDGDNPAAVAYLQRQFGDLRCADSDKDALAGQRTLTKDGMLVSGGEIERLRPVSPAQFRIGAGSTSHRSAVQGELERAQKTILELEGQERALNGLVSALQHVAHEDSVLKYVSDAWSAMEDAQHEVTSKTELLKGAADEDYVRLGEEETAARQRAAAAEGRLREVAEEIGGAKARLAQCESREVAATAAANAAHTEATEARQHPEVDKDFEARKWDELLDKHCSAYSAMMQQADDQQGACRRRMAGAINAGTKELGIFLQKYREHAPQDIAADWLKAREWLKDLLKQLNDTQLAPFKDDVAIALNNNLEWVGETMDRLNAVLRECPTFSNGERYRFRRVVRPQLEFLLKFVKNVAAYGPAEDLLGGPGELPEEFRALLEDKVTPGATGVRSPLDDYREFFEFDIEILREDPLTKAPKVVGHLSKRLGPGSGGEHRAPLYVIAGAALASAYRLDRGHKDGLRLMLLDEAFNKMDPTNIIATMRYLEELGLQVFMASPGENLGILTAFLHRYYDILRDVDNNAVMIEGREVLPETRAMFREDLPEFNPGLVDQEVATMRRGTSATQVAMTV
jgi:energy-coupling factor transporter ATP-binding protein EcfA2